MAKIIKIMTSLDKEQTQSLRSHKKLEGFDNMQHIHHRIKDAIRQFMRDNVGYDKVPIAALSRYNNDSGEISKVQHNIREHIPTLAGYVLFELHMPEDMIISVSAENLIIYTEILQNSGNESLNDIYMEEFKDCMHLGYPTDKGEDIVSFIPFIDASRCKFFAHIDRSWNISELDMPGMEQIHLANMSMF
jgi:hypothetical protein